MKNQIYIQLNNQQKNLLVKERERAQGSSYQWHIRMNKRKPFRGTLN